MRAFVRLIAAIVALSFAGAAAASGSEAPWQFNHSSWTSRDGVPSMVQVLAQTPDGYLWLGTYEGLFRFDGVSFEYVAPAPGHPAGSVPVNSLLVTRRGDLWIGYAGGAGVEVRRGGRMLRGGMPSPPGEVSQLVEDLDGGIWVVGGRGRGALKRYWRGAWQRVDARWRVPDKDAVSNILVARDGTVWLATQKRLLFLRRGTTMFEETGFIVADGASMAEDDRGAIWLADAIGTRKVPDFPHGASAAGGHDAYPAVGPVRRTSILFDRAGNLWGTTYTAGVFLLRASPARPGRFADVARYRGGAGLTSDQAVALLQDREGNIWVATELGLDQFRRSGIDRVPLPPQTSAFGYTMGIDATRDIYIASGPVLYRARRGQEPEAVMSGAEGQALCPARDGAMWYAVPGRLLKLRGGAVAATLPLPGDTPVSGCAETGDGRLWLVRRNPGLLFHDPGGAWRSLTLAGDNRGPRETAVQPRARLVITLARRSIVLIDGGRSTTLSNARIGVTGLTVVYGTPRALLIGGGTGLARYDGTRIRRLLVADHPWLRGVRGIVQTGSGWTWMLTNRGVVRIGSADLDRAFATPTRAIRHDLFDEQDGFASRTQISEGLQLAASADGRLWILTRQGVLRVDPSRLRRNTAPPPVTIRALTADGHRYADPSRLDLRAGLRNLSIDYTGLSMTVPSRVRFRYKLEGVDADWVDPGTRRQAFYTNLWPGTYRFRVVAANNDGVWNYHGDTLEFTIPRTLLQSPAFMLLYVIAAAAFFWLLYRLRLRSVARGMRDRMAERLAERERIARELHDTLLQGVQALMLRFHLVADDLSPDQPTRQALEEALDRADAVLAEGRDRVRDLRITEAGDDLERVIRDIVRRHDFPPTTQIVIDRQGEPRPLNPLVADEIALIANEALFNVWRHAEASRVDVEIAFRTPALTLVIRDNGIGIPPAILDAGRREGHFGLSGMRERAQRMHGDLAIGSDATGTQVALTVTGAFAYAQRRRPVTGIKRGDGA